jgi:ABC-type nickel/cobalt efflux system permease component RcnA
MSATLEEVPAKAVETGSIATLVAGWMSATSSRIRITTELAFAEARLAAVSLTLMVLMGMLSALFVLCAWGLVVAGLVAVLLKVGISLWLTLTSLGLLHVLGAWLLWRGTVRLSRYLEFAATRQQFQQFQQEQEVGREVDTAATAG